MLCDALAGCRVVGLSPDDSSPFFSELRRGLGRRRGQVFSPAEPPQPWTLLTTTAVPRRLRPDEAGRYPVVGFPEETLDRVREGNGLLVLDMSTEGPAFAPWMGRHLHGALEQARIPPERAALLIQNTRFALDYRAWAAATGARAVHVIAANAYAVGMWVRMTGMAPMPHGYHLGFALDHDGPRRHRFVCLNFTLRAARAMLVAWLLERPEQGFISFSIPRPTPYSEPLSGFPEAVRHLAMPADYAAHWARVERLLAAKTHLASDADHFAAPRQRVYSLPVEEVAASELFIVTETEIAGPEQQRFTEKTLKALISGLPFVVFGCAGVVASLRAAGCDVLDDVVDHGYDLEVEPRQRFDAALRAVARFLARPPGFTVVEMDRLRMAAARNRAAFHSTFSSAMVLGPLSQLLALRPQVPPEGGRA